MPQVIQPGPAQNNDRSLFQLGGAIIGAATAGPGGALAGASTGAALGGTASDVAQSNNAQAPTPVPSPGTSALARRQQQLETDNLTTLRNAEMAAARLPEQQRQRILPTLTQARMLEQRQRGVT